MITAQEKTKAVIASLHARHLKGLNFRKGGNTWIRENQWPQVINVQLSQWNTSEAATLTLNCGIFIEAFHQAIGGLPLKGALKEYDCDIRSRIGSLHSDKKDIWWTVTSQTNADDLAETLFAEIRDFVLPWFERLVTFENIALEFVTQKNPFKAAIAYHLAGMPDESKTLMSQALTESNELRRRNLIRTAKSLSISTGG